MKNIYLAVLLLCLCASCRNENWDCNAHQEVIIYGNHIDRSSLVARGSENHLLEDGTTISLYAKGGFQSDGLIFTLNQAQWKGQQVLTWSNGQATAKVCAYTPPLPGGTDQLYQADGQLKDVLIAQQDCTPAQPVCLSFQHLFTQIIFKVEASLNAQLQQLTLIPHQEIASIDPYTAQITVSDRNVSDQTPVTGIDYQPQADGVYSLLLAPAVNQALTIYLKKKDGTILHKQVAPMNLERNQAYTCQIKEKTVQVGIQNAEDFIAFTHLINGQAYGSRTLQEFGTAVGNRMTYCLNGDIDFTGIDPKRIRQIGVESQFNDIFDGQGFTLKGLSLVSDQSSTEGLFSIIGQQGIVKNLNLEQATTSFTKGTGIQGILCGKNNGCIDHCCIRNSTITLYKQLGGGITGYNAGTIMNCEVNGITMTSTRDKSEERNIAFGGISYSNYASGKILNCFVDHLERGKDKLNINHLSAISQANDGKLSNCLAQTCSDQFHPYSQNPNQPVDHCYYAFALGIHVQITPEEHQEYSIWAFKDTESKKKVVQKLNTWASQEGKSLYPGFSFRLWKLDTNTDIGFE